MPFKICTINIILEPRAGCGEASICNLRAAHWVFPHVFLSLCETDRRRGHYRDMRATSSSPVSCQG